MIRFRNGRPEVIDGVEEINILCDIFKVPEEVRSQMVSEYEKKEDNISVE